MRQRQTVMYHRTCTTLVHYSMYGNRNFAKNNTNIRLPIYATISRSRTPTLIKYGHELPWNMRCPIHNCSVPFIIAHINPETYCLN